MPLPGAEATRVTLEASFPLTEAALALRAEAFALEWGNVSQLGIYPSDAQFGKLVKLRLRCSANDAACKAASWQLVADAETERNVTAINKTGLGP